MYRDLAPTWWDGIDGMTVYDFTEYLRCVFLESDIDVAVLTSNPGVSERRMLFNDELAGTREVVDRLAGTGRLLNHSVVHPNHGETDRMEAWRDRFDPVGWKVYTLGKLVDGDWVSTLAPRRRRRTPVPRRGGATRREARLRPQGHRVPTTPARSPEDVGPAARAHPNVAVRDLPLRLRAARRRRRRKGRSTTPTRRGCEPPARHPREHDLGPGDNVSAELGTTWFCLLRHPEAAAHVLGKLLAQLGEDNVIWGSDSIWYGPNRPLVDAFRAFQIPERLRAEFGYPELTPQVKEKILGLNAARSTGSTPPRPAPGAATTTSGGSARSARSTSAPGCRSPPEAVRRRRYFFTYTLNVSTRGWPKTSGRYVMLPTRSGL